MVAEEAELRVVMKHKLPGRQDTSKPEISWRGDGKFFAVNHNGAFPGTRCVSIFDNTGKLECVQDKLKLGPLISWRFCY